jgi:CheY-like chemotaxis protein
MAHVLIVDDELEVVKRNAKALEAGGHRVTVASTTREALEVVRRDEPNAVVLEAMLDGSLAGFDLARSLAHRLPALPLVMLTRVDEYISDAELARQDRDGGWLPVDRFLQKPVMPEVLAYEVDHLLEAAA